MHIVDYRSSHEAATHSASSSRTNRKAYDFPDMPSKNGRHVPVHPRLVVPPELNGLGRSLWWHGVDNVDS